MAQNSLGVFFFIEWQQPGDPGRPPSYLREEVAIGQRAGVDGTGLWLLGKKGKPFQMQSGVDEASQASAQNLLKSYSAAVGGGLYKLVWQGVDFETVHQTRFAILDVEPLSVRRLSAASGGLGAVQNYWVSALWTLVGIGN